MFYRAMWHYWKKVAASAKYGNESMENPETQATAKTVDVVIPVYNAPELTKRCIDSIVTHLGKSIQRVLIQDDASGCETREMLDHLPYPCVEVCHAEKNQGFGLTVNAAVGRSNAFYVLILNSDTEVNQNILPQLCAAFDADDKLAAIIPAGNSYNRFNKVVIYQILSNFLLCTATIKYAGKTHNGCPSFTRKMIEGM